MSKLKRVKKSDSDWQKCCRWCSYYKNGRCTNEDSTSLDEIEFDDIIIEVSFEKTLKDIPLKQFRELEYLLRDFGVSEKRIKEFDSTFSECWKSFSNETLKPELVDCVSMCYEDYLSHKDTSCSGIYIEDPENFVCNKWR